MNELGTELIKTFKAFLTRDLTFITGGSIILITVAYVFYGFCLDQLIAELKDLPWPLWVLITCICYVVGYAIQDLTALLTPFTKSTHPLKVENRQKDKDIDVKNKESMNWFLRGLYQCFTNEEWPGVKIYDHLEILIEINQRRIPEKCAAELERITMFQMIGTTIGPCLGLSGTLLLLKVCKNNDHLSATAVLVLVLLVFPWLVVFLFRTFFSLKKRFWVDIVLIMLIAVAVIVMVFCGSEVVQALKIYSKSLLAAFLISGSVGLILLGWVKCLQRIYFLVLLRDKFPCRPSGA